MEDLSARCVRVDPESAPSVSYLSMIERGKRVPSAGMLAVMAAVFQKEVSWFLDDAPEEQAITPDKGRRGGVSGMPLEPGFLFSNDILQIAIPEMLSQTGISGRQFAHLLIRAHQEHHQNHFPDLERAAEEVGKKRLPLSVEEMLDLAAAQGLKIQWFARPAKQLTDAQGICTGELVTSYMEPPGTLFLNEILKSQPTRLKYDLAVHIGHCVLHNRDGLSNVLTVGRSGFSETDPQIQSSSLNAQDILQAWRGFEASFFAGALLCPKVAFRQLLDRYGYEIDAHRLAGGFSLGSDAAYDCGFTLSSLALFRCLCSGQAKSCVSGQRYSATLGEYAGGGRPLSALGGISDDHRAQGGQFGADIHSGCGATTQDLLL